MGLISLLGHNPTIFFIIVVSIIFALTVHECAHGYIAYIHGDDTAYLRGRLTLNPLAHLDPIGSLMILFIGIGYAKPVPVNPYNLDNPRIDMIKVAAAGPISNFILSFIGVLMFVLLGKLELLNNSSQLFFTYFIMINTWLGLFNLIPVYPLDGGQIFGNIISKYNSNIFKQLNQYGPRILLAVIGISILTQGRISIIGWIIEKPARFIVRAFELIAEFILFFL